MAVAGWQWIFLLNIPAVTIVIVIAAFAVEETRADAARSIDLSGMVLSAVALFGGVFALLRTADADWRDGLTWGGLGIALVSVLLFMRVEAGHRMPMLDLKLFRHRTFTASVLVSLLSGASYYAVLVYLPLHFQAVGHLDSLSAGLALLPMTLPILFCAPIGGWLAPRLDSELFLGTGMTFVGLGLAALGLVSPGGGWPSIAILAVIGIGNGIINAQLTAAVADAAPADLASLASGLASMSRHTGFALGTAALGLVLASQIGSDLLAEGVYVDADTALLIATGAFDRFALEGGRDAAAHAFTFGLRVAIDLAAIFALAAGAIGILMPRPSGSRIGGATK